jgi:hypothetical protein
MSKLIISILVLLLLSCNYYADEIIPHDSSSVVIKPKIRCVQAEITTAVYSLEYGLLFDFDMIEFKSVKGFTIGLRSGFEKYAYIEFGGPTAGNPFTDYYAMVRMTESRRRMSLTLNGGYSYHTTSDPKFYKSKHNLRAGFEIRYLLIKDFMALILKTNTSFTDKTTSGGIGISFGLYR